MTISARQTHQQRCETCGYYIPPSEPMGARYCTAPGRLFGKYGVKKYLLNQHELLHVQEMGCATHTSPPAPFDLDDDRMYTSAEVKAAYAYGTKDARKKVLDKLFEKLMEKRFLTDLSSSYIVWSGDVEEIIESLRADAEVQK